MTTSVAKSGKHSLIDAFSALGDKNRYQIFQLLSRDTELCVSQVASEIGISTAGVSQHMKVLEKAGLVRPHRLGQKICYQVTSEKSETAKLLKLIRS